MRLSPLALLVSGLLLLPIHSSAADARGDIALDLPQPPELVSKIYFSNRDGHGGLTKAAPADSFYLYGGPGSLEGKFQTADGLPDWQGWFGVDLTELDVNQFWQVSTFNAENLNNHGSGNHAYWCGRSAEQEPNWATPPGYGNNWSTSLGWSSGPLNDPSSGQTVDLDFYFNHDTEPAYDYLHVEYDSAGTWITVFEIDGSNKNMGGVFPAPGVHFPDDVLSTPIDYVGNDYGGPGLDEIRLRVRFTSDGVWSDEDGMFDSDAGAFQLDDLLVQWQDLGPQSSFEDFESAGPYLWTVEEESFVGDFAKLFFGLLELDPCATNPSSQLTFIDDGTPPSNATVGTGGSLPNNYGCFGDWYGIPGDYVVNYTGGLTYGAKSLTNEAWSPPIAWDLPGPEDDGIEGGAQLRFGVFRDFPLINGIFYVWHVRSSSDGGMNWSGWKDLSWIYYVGCGYYRDSYEVGTLLVPGVTHVQIALGVHDMAYLFDFPGNDATPAPWFDNVALVKYDPPGPAITADASALFQDTFPNSGEIDYLADANLLSCRMDQARDLLGNYSPDIVHGDSLVVYIEPTEPGTSLASSALHWTLDVNPMFSAVREMPPGTTVSAGTASNGWDQWSGEVAGQPCTTVSGGVVAGRYFFDMPYEGPSRAAYQNDGPETMFFPGDVLRYYIEAIDTGGGVSTLPADLSYYPTSGHDRAFTVRALPSMFPSGMGGVWQPRTLVLNQRGHGEWEELYVWTLQHNWFMEHSDFGSGNWAFDMYTVNDGGGGRGNGIGAAGACGATAEQLAGYEIILYLAGDLDGVMLSDDSNSYPNDKSDDLQLLEDWHLLPGERGIAYFADNLCEYLDIGAAGFAYMNFIMGVEYVGRDVKPYIDNQTSPWAEPGPYAPFTEGFVAAGGCPSINEFDAIRPQAGAFPGHEFYAPGWYPYPSPSPVASVYYQRAVNSWLKTDITFPFGLEFVELPGKTWQNEGRVLLMGEVMSALGNSGAPYPPPTSVPSLVPSLVMAGNAPNPFNPRTVLRFAVGREAAYRVEIYDLRGRRVRTLHDGPLEAGPQEMVWTGVDEHGRSVASGVYVARVTGDGLTATHKMALVR